jgi:hypothetical protein
VIGPLLRAIQIGIQDALKNPGVKRYILLTMANPRTHTYIKETISEFASTCNVRLNNGEVRAQIVTQYVQKNYTVGNVSNSTVIQGEHIVNNTTIYIHIEGKNYHKIMDLLSKVPDIRNQLDNYIPDDYALKKFANITLDPFLGELQKLVSESTDYDKLEQALKIKG